MNKDHVIKIGDFGCIAVLSVKSRMVHDDDIGTALYLSPERWQGNPFGAPADVWALGLLIYEMCTLTLPFRGKSEIIQKPHRSIPKDRCSEGRLVDIIDLMLKKNPLERPKIEEILVDPVVVSYAGKFGFYLSYPIHLRPALVHPGAGFRSVSPFAAGPAPQAPAIRRPSPVNPPKQQAPQRRLSPMVNVDPLAMVMQKGPSPFPVGYHWCVLCGRGIGIIDKHYNCIVCRKYFVCYYCHNLGYDGGHSDFCYPGKI